MLALLRTLGWTFALGCAAISLTANVVYGFSVTSGIASFAFAFGGACLDGIKTILPTGLAALPKERTNSRRFGGWLLWCGLVAWSFFCAMQVYEQSRVGRVGQVEADKQAYATRAQDLAGAQSRLEQLRAARSQEVIQAEIDQAKLARPYSRSRECARVTADDSRTLCQKLAGLEGEKAGAMTAAEIKEAIATETAKETKAKKAVDGADLQEVVTITDAGTQGLANMAGVGVEAMRRYLAFLFAALIEVSGGLGGWILTGGHLPTWRKNNAESACVDPHTDPTTPPEPRPSPNPVRVWASLCTLKRKETWIYATEAWQAFNAWAMQNGYAPMDQTAFGTQMTEMQVARGKRNGKTIYRDLALLPAKKKAPAIRLAVSNTPQ